jgi:RNA polymerase sigma factor (sigma-70 family)
VAGDPPAGALSADAFVRAHYGFAFRVLRRAGLSPSDADDAAQRVFLVASARLSEIKPGSERAFVYRTARRVASVAHRSARRRPDSHELESDHEIDGSPQPDELVEQRRARALLDSILRELPEDLSAALVLFDIEGLTRSCGAPWRSSAMSELKRWADDGASDEVRNLLVAAGAEQPSRSSLGRALSAVAAGVAVSAGSATASGAAVGIGAKVATFAGDVVVRWVMAATVFTTGGAAAVVLLHEPAPKPAPVRVASVVANSAAPSPSPPARALPPSTPTFRAGPPVAPERAVTHASPPPSASASEPLDPLAEELSFVDGARGALAAGQPLEALQALDRYDARPSRRGFASEALYLRMRALLALGRGDEARAVAGRLSSSYPNSPQAARARQVLAGDDSVIRP